LRCLKIRRVEIEGYFLGNCVRSIANIGRFDTGNRNWHDN